MTSHFTDDWLTIHQGDVREVLPTLPADSVDCIVTSPPYWGLRDYGTATWIGGDALHEHIGVDLRTADTGGPKQQTKRGSIGVRSGDCDCGATRQDGQLGLEATPEQYVANLVGVFRELRRVLKPSGTCWLNLGDSYATGGGSVGRAPGGGDQGERFIRAGMINTQPNRMPIPGLKPKDLVGIPWRVAFALQADGWWLRSDIIWAKPNPMPESVTDRPTKAHEYLFLLTKSARYYFDADAVAETTISHPAGNGFDRQERISGGLAGGNPEPWKPRESKPRGSFNGKTEAMPGRNAFRAITATRNLRSVWTIATRPYPGAHFAVFPPELPERCIKAGSPEGGVVLDPFAGSGTVGLVANRLSRRAILIDLNPAYLEQQMQRNAQTVVGL